MVESVGEGVNSIKIGDHVICLFLPQCKKCRVCNHEDSNTCLEFFNHQVKCLLDETSTRFTCKGQQILQFMGCSTFSEFTVVKEFSLAKINQKAPLDIICVLSCGFTTGYGAAAKTAKVKKGSTCAVWGLGTIGLAAVVGCKNAGASKIIGIDTNDSKFELAKEFGVTDFVNPKNVTDLMSSYLEKTFNAIDFTFECVGSIATMRQAFESCAIGNGVCVLIGVSPQEQELSIFPIQFLMGKTLTGELFGSYKGVDEVPLLVEDYLAGKLPLDKFVTHNKSLNEINDAMDLLKDGKCIRCVIKNY